jgi:acyl carrier protein
MAKRKHIKDTPDWPALRKTIAEKVGKSEAEIDELAERVGDSLDLVEFVMALEEAFGTEIHL